MDKVLKWLKNVWNLFPALVGLIEVAIPLVKELAVIVARLIGVLLINAPQPIIDKINSVYDETIKWIEKIKNAMLLVK